MDKINIKELENALLSSKESVIDIVGINFYEEKLQEAKEYLIKAKTSTMVEMSYPEIAATRIDWLNNLSTQVEYSEEEKQIDNYIFAVAGVELKKESKNEQSWHTKE